MRRRREAGPDTTGRNILELSFDEPSAHGTGAVRHIPQDFARWFIETQTQTANRAGAVSYVLHPLIL